MTISTHWLILFLVVYIGILIYAVNRWPDFFNDNSNDPPVFPPCI